MTNQELWSPRPSDLFRHYKLTKPHEVKCVFVAGYPDLRGHSYSDGLALSFSNYGVVEVPMASYRLRGVYERDLDIISLRNKEYYLDSWAANGVLLMNSCLTSKIGDVSHNYHHITKGWAYLTYQTIVGLDHWKRNIPFVFFGRVARDYHKLVLNNPVIVLPDPANNSFAREAAGLFTRLNAIMPKKVRWLHPYDRPRPKGSAKISRR